MSDPLQYDNDRRIERIERNLRRLNRITGRPAIPGVQVTPTGDVHFTGGVVLGPGQEKVVEPTDVPPPTNLVVTAGSSWDTVFLDVSWDAPIGYGADQVAAYVVQVQKSGEAPIEQTVNAGTTLRVEPLEPSTTYTVRLASVSKTNRNSAFVTDSKTTSIDTTAPSNPIGVTVVTFVQSLVIAWAENTERDVRNNHGYYRVIVSTSPTLASPAYDKRVSGSSVWVGNLNPSTAYYVGVKAVDSSGNQSGTTIASGGPFTPDRMGTNGIADGVVTDAKISSLSVAKLTAGVMSAAVVVGGTLATAATGARIELSSDSNNWIRFRTGDAGELEEGYIGVWRLGGPTDGTRYYYVDVKGPTINGTVEFASSPVLRLASRDAIGVKQNVAELHASADTYLWLDPGLIVLRQQPRNLLQILGTDHSHFISNYSSTFNLVHGFTEQQLTCQIRGSGGFADVRFPALPSSSTDPLMRYATSSGQLFRDSSTAKYKHNITDFADTFDLEAIDQLRVVAYQEKDFNAVVEGDPSALKPGHFMGLLAEELAEVYPSLVCFDEDGEPEGILYDKLPALALEAILDLRKRVKELEDAR